MSISYLQIIIMLFAVAIGLASIWGLIVPGRLTGMVKTFWVRNSSMPIAVVVRLTLGAVLIAAAPDTRFPLIFQVIGWFTIIAAILLLVLGKERIGRLIAWLAEQPDAMIRACLIFGLAFAVFLIYGAWV